MISFCINKYNANLDQDGFLQINGTEIIEFFCTTYVFYNYKGFTGIFGLQEIQKVNFKGNANNSNSEDVD
jgi:hypothetical protein